MGQFLQGAISFVPTLLIAIVVFGALIFIHELGHFLTAKWSGIKVNEFSIGMGPKLWVWQKGETLYALRLLPIGGYVSMEGEDEESDEPRAFQRAAVWKRIIVTAAGAVMNLVLGFIVLVIVVCLQGQIVSRTIYGFQENAASQQCGLQQGDTIVAVNGRRCYIANDISYELARSVNGTADLTVERDGETVQLEDVRFNSYTLNGQQQSGLDFIVYGLPLSPVAVLKEAAAWTMSYARLVVLSFADLVTGRIPVTDLSGPVGIVQTIGQVSTLGLESLLLLVALITVNLGVFNLLPVPALDGGRLVFLILEAIRRKPVPQKFEIAVNAAGFVLLIGLMLFATFNDITRLIA